MRASYLGPSDNQNIVLSASSLNSLHVQVTARCMAICMPTGYPPPRPSLITHVSLAEVCQGSSAKAASCKITAEFFAQLNSRETIKLAFRE